MRRIGRRGFILPLSVLLVVILTISGTSFMHHDYLERRMTINNVGNHGAFYLANAGIERAKETFKIPDTLTWTTVLQGTYDGPDPDALPDYPSDPSPVFCPLCLCGPDSSRGCVIPSFGVPVNSGIPFSGTFDDGQYEVRAFNNEPGTTDTDQKITFRALGTVRGEQKLLEATVLAVSGLNLVNCQGTPGVNPCPDTTNGNPDVRPTPGREPESTPTLPSMPPLADPITPSACYSANYYCYNSTDFSLHFPGLTVNTYAIDINLTDNPNPNKPGDVLIQPNHYYFTSGNASIDHVNNSDNIIVVGLGNIEVGSGVNLLTRTTVAGAGSVRLRGGVELHAPIPLPAVISNAAVQADANVQIFGTVYSSGTVDLNPITVHGVIIGDPVEIQGGENSFYTDDGNIAYYALMPGFEYPEELKTTVTVPGENSWRELQ